MFTGSIPALVTPFTNGEVDKLALKELVEWHIEMGSSGVVKLTDSIYIGDKEQKPLRL